MAEGARLESVFTGNRNVGSNPTLSAIIFHKHMILLNNTHRADLSRRVSRTALAAAPISFLVMPGTAQAATGLDGAAMSWPWALPFAGLLLSIAAGPL